MALTVLAPLLGGCAGASMSDVFSSDLMSKDAAWFSRPGRTFIKNVSIETPPLTPDKPVTPDDLISADGQCAGAAPPADANALSNGPAAAPTTTASATSGHVALGHTECDVVRGAGTPDNVNLSNSAGERVVVLTYARGPRAGIYTFRAGRLSSIEKAPEAAPAKPTRAKSKKQQTG
ncbi:MAG: hypothetical protein BGP05_19735 [Rhizobiales bacterium 62-47]|nr:hypothetical protein [Hyphomicrobiales bacterium]OJY09982.1 MAG: hypothetical protein BGP05_19735 [Rhizobiales bacterium 62-47]